MFSRIWGWLSGAKQAPNRSSGGTLAARYDAAQTTNDNARHWAAADGKSAAMACSPTVRQTLRKRARYECLESNSYALGIVQTYANDCIGTGPRLQLEADGQDKIERDFAKWAKRVKLAQKLRTMRVSKMVDGENVAILFTNSALPNDLPQLDIALVECDRLALPWQRNGILTDTSDGIEYDAFGNPTEYHILDSHPGDLLALQTGKWYSAADVIHQFRADRPGQQRGVPEVTPALPLFANLRRFTLAVIQAAETAANFAAVLKTTSPTVDAVQDTGKPFATIDIERNAMLTLPAHWDIGQFRAEQPTTTYGEFKAEILNEIARCLSMPYNVAAGNSSKYNYSSGRLDHQVYHRAIYIDRDQIETEILDRIFVAWIAEYVLLKSNIFADQADIERVYSHSWQWDAFISADPQTEAQAAATLLQNGLVSEKDYHAQQGTDWKQHHAQLAKERESRVKHRLLPAGMPPGQMGNAATTPPATEARV